MLRNQVETAILSFGLDPALGCMHRDGYKLPSLVFDLMEPYRPFTDRLLIEAVLNKKLTDAMETDELGNRTISRPGRIKLINLFNEKLHKMGVYNKAKTSLLNLIMLDTKSLVDQIKRYEE
jgi:CRISPR-associated protein Cas1